MGNVRYSNTATSSHRTEPSRFCNAVLSANLEELVQRTREGRVCVWKGIMAWEASNNQSCKLQEEEAVDIWTLFTHRNISYDLLQGTLEGRRRRERSGNMWLLLSCPLHNVLPLAGAFLCPLCHCGQVVSRRNLHASSSRRQRGGGPSSVAPRSHNPPTGRRRDSPISSYVAEQHQRLNTTVR